MRHLQAGAVFLDIARGAKKAPSDPGEHYLATDILSRDIRAYTASLMKEDLPYEQLDLVASLIEEADFTAALAESLHQVARRVKREKFGSRARPSSTALDKLDASPARDHAELRHCRTQMPAGHVRSPRSRNCACARWRRPGTRRTRHDPGAARLRRACRTPDPPHRCRAQASTGAGVLAKINAAAADRRERLPIRRRRA